MGGQIDSIHKIYDNPEANQIAQDLGISVETYWLTFNDLAKFLDEMSETYQLSQEKSLLPIYPAEVFQYEDLFAQASAREGIPINVLAILTTIESAGIASASTAAGAIGLNQVMIRWHKEKVIQVANELLDSAPQGEEGLKEALLNPKVNIFIAASILREYYNIAQKSGHDREKPSTLGRVFAAYNSGSEAIKNHYYEWHRSGDAVRTQLHALMALTFFLDAEVAARMRASGASDIEIRHALSSDKLAATVWAYIKQGENMNWTGSKDIKDFEYRRSTLLSLQESKVAMAQHMNGEHKFLLENLPTSLRIWTMHGGLGLFGRSAENMNPINYR